ncbi:MAG: HAD family phosphatase [Rikenellaceae bacterium]
MIEAIITDFDGTLVDTYQANYLAYEKAFVELGLELTSAQYKECYGLRFTEFMQSMGIEDLTTVAKIKALKKDYYPLFFKYLKPNTALIELIRSYQNSGRKTAIASTASKANLMNAIEHLNLSNIFDLVYTATDVVHAKPSPEIYEKTMCVLAVRPEETLIFEDSQVGLAAAKSSGAHVLQITL